MVEVAPSGSQPPPTSSILRPAHPNGLLAEARAGRHIGPMEFTPADHRLVPDRRSGADRRRVVRVVVQDRRSGEERRLNGERRGTDAPADHIHNALELLTHVAESGTLDEASLRDLDAAMFRLRFALHRIERAR